MTEKDKLVDKLKEVVNLLENDSDSKCPVSKCPVSKCPLKQLKISDKCDKCPLREEMTEKEFEECKKVVNKCLEKFGKDSEKDSEKEPEKCTKGCKCFLEEKFDAPETTVEVTKPLKNEQLCTVDVISSLIIILLTIFIIFKVMSILPVF